MTDPYYTHRPFLEEELIKLSKKKKKIKILEFGVGHGSSYLMKEFATKYKNFNINAYENDANWLHSMKCEYESDNYIFNKVESWDILLKLKNFKSKYDLVFIDQSPWEARIQTLDLLRSKASVFIIHDYDYYNHDIFKAGKITNIYELENGNFFKKYEDDFDITNHYETLPPTLVMRRK